jgi:hypothetical protein
MIREFPRKSANVAMAEAKSRSIFSGLKANSRARPNREFRFGEQGIAGCGTRKSREFIGGEFSGCAGRRRGAVARLPREFIRDGFESFCA